MLGAVLRRALRALHEERESDPVPSELRGWSWDRPPLRPRARLGISVSDIAYGSRCGWRSLWLKRKANIAPQPPPAAKLGQAVHEAFMAATNDASRLVMRGRPWEIAGRLWSAERRFEDTRIAELYKALLVSLAGEATQAFLVEGGAGAGSLWLSEYKVNGWPLGLSKSLRVDVISEGGLILEVKLGRRAKWQELSLAGYALALESQMESPVDYGVLVNVILGDRVSVDYEPVYISPTLRRKFIEHRDEAIDALLSPEEPEELCREEEQ